MVPVAVLREIDGEDGALVEWIEDAIAEIDRRNGGIEPPDMLRWRHQQDVMAVFDALILNDDRHLNNSLITQADWKLHLIDHSRAFRPVKKLPEEFEQRVSSLPRPVYDRLVALDKQRLKDILSETLSGVQIGAVLARRDRIVEKVQADVAKYGEGLVFHAPAPEAGAVPAAAAAGGS